jgi:type I restriction enzyme S subunit
MINKNTKILNDICELIIDCEHKTAPIQETGYPSIRTPNIGKGYLILDNVNRVSEETYQSWTKRAIPQADDLILAREAPVGNVAIIPENLKVCLGQRTVLIRPDKNKVNPQYLLYLLLGDEIQAKLHSFSNGATVHHLNMKDIRNLVLPELPNISIQHKIADILSAYEDLIENNTRQIKILEEMAALIYREWFVNFRFPGHEQVKMVDSQLGLIPEGWEPRKVSEVATVYRGKSYKSSELLEDGGLPFLNLKCINRDGGFRNDGIKRFEGKYKSTQTATSGNIIMAVTDMTQERRVIARAARVPQSQEKEFVFSMDLVKIAPSPEIHSDYFYSFLRFSNFADCVKEHANGSNVLHLNPKHIEEFAFALPAEILIKQYANICSDIYEQYDVLVLENDNLRKTRDLLLPKLISGEIDLETLNTPEINLWAA